MKLTPLSRGFVEGMMLCWFVYGSVVAGILLPVLWAWSRHAIRVLEAAP